MGMVQPLGVRAVDAAGRPARALVLSGGIAFGAFEAGAYAALEEAGGPPVQWLAGSSGGAGAAAPVSGQPPRHRGAGLRGFWGGGGRGANPNATPPFRPPPRRDR